MQVSCVLCGDLSRTPHFPTPQSAPCNPAARHSNKGMYCLFTFPTYHRPLVPLHPFPPPLLLFLDFHPHSFSSLPPSPPHVLLSRPPTSLLYPNLAGCRSSQTCLWYGGSVPLDSAAAAKRVKGGGEVAAPLLPPECMDRARASGKDEPSAMAYCYFQTASCADVYSPMDRGARGDGKSDDSSAFLAAFNAACSAAKKANKRTVLRIPRGKTLLLNYVTMQGPCGPGVTIKLDGKIVAPENPPSSKSWPGDFSGAVLQAKQAHGLWIVGDGEMDGRGDRRWWPMYHGNELPRELKRPVLLDIFASYSVTLAGFKNRNPAGMHMNIFRSGYVRVSNVTVESPADSPNTDGIHIGSSSDVVVEFSNIHTGDDNISIEEGAHRVTIANIWGTAGHGISIGSLGAHGTVACVSDVTVRNVVLTDTDNGLRIKTYQGGRGLVKNIQFKNVLMKNIKLPIVIDQVIERRFHLDQEVAHLTLPA
ncbi:unnamed protein product [Closterium sp. Naga37s-1]|nr:unnamed protein product [Closterium sp. Naga37s-1]